MINYKLFSKDPTQACILLIHGLFGSVDNLAMLRKELEQDYQVLCIDLPDHGLSSRTEQFSFEAYSQAIWTLIDELGYASVILVGHSLGGKVAMQMAIDQPAKVNHLVVMDIAPVKYQARHQRVFEGLNNVELAKLNSRQQAQQSMAKSIVEPSVIQFLLKSLYQQDGNWEWRFNLALLERDYSLLSAALAPSKPCKCPTLFLKGELSDYLKDDYRSAVVERFPNSKARVVSGVGHWLHAEKPKVCARIIQQFVGS